MSIFKKEPKFVAAICPQCGGNLEMDSTLQTAFCQSCGAHCLMENVKKQKQKNPTAMQSIIGFVERQQELRRKDKAEKRQREEEEKKKHEAQIKKYWWIYALVMVGLFAFIAVMAILE